MTKLYVVGVMLMLAACGGAVEPQEQAEAQELGEVESAVTYCGHDCPAGTHPTSYSCSYTCGSCYIGAPTNRVNCEPDTGSFTSCGGFCPTGWRAVSWSCNYNCGSCYTGAPTNSVYCVPQ